MKKCPKCRRYKANIKKVTAAQHLAIARADSKEERDRFIGPEFEYCPWCGAKLKEA